MFNNSVGKSSMAKALNRLSDVPSVLNMSQYKSASDVGSFESKLEGYISDIKSKFKPGMNLSDEVTKIAERDSLTDDEIDRVCQSINMSTYQDLFDKSIGKEDRGVKFSIAKPEQVKKAVNGTSEEVSKEASELDGDMEKKAGPKDIVSAILNYNPEGRNTKYSRAAVPEARRDYLFEKIAKDISSDFEKLASVESDINEDLQTMGVCFCKYASDVRGIDYQKVFDRMSFRAGLRRGTQIKIRNKFDDMKGVYKIASDVSLNLIDVSSVEDFSLGNHSISKIAEAEVSALPDVVDKKRDVRDFEKLVQIALKIQDNDSMLEDINNKIEAKRQIVNANDELIEEEENKED